MKFIFAGDLAAVLIIEVCARRESTGRIFLAVCFM